MVTKPIPEAALLDASFDIERAATVLAALAHPVRYSMVSLMVDRAWSLRRLQKWLGITKYNAVHHMKIICEAGLVHTRAKGRVIYYKVDSEAAFRIVAYLGQAHKPQR